MVFEKWETVYKTATGIYIFVDNPHLLGYNLWLWYLTKWRRRLKEFKSNHFVTKKWWDLLFSSLTYKMDLFGTSEGESLITLIIDNLFIPLFLMFVWENDTKLAKCTEQSFHKCSELAECWTPSSSGGYPGGCAAWFHGEDGAHPWNKA